MIDEKGPEAAALAALNDHRERKGWLPVAGLDVMLEHDRDHWIADARAAITAYLSTLSLSTRITLVDGTEAVVMPRYATDAMCEAAWESDAADYVGEHKRLHSAYDAYAAMLSALETK